MAGVKTMHVALCDEFTAQFAEALASARSGLLYLAMLHLRAALRAANRLACSRRRQAAMRSLNRVRAAARRAGGEA